ncbi:hypothetical protein AVEN_259157-1 [Araneus ventricosus]|uniref:Uncharacterized protein n=1 Tax=Araneus ventricosus TaxID=182803 RepID=A0A4Y2PAE6_ARAVE|nr:hypothetical protein AVEN_259157-1 [Araneus ventricosus]
MQSATLKILTCGHDYKNREWVALLFTEDEARNRPIPLDPYETNGPLESTGKLTGPFARLERPNVPSPSTGPGPPPDRTCARHGFDPGGFLEGVYSNPDRSARRRPFYEQGRKTGTRNPALLRKDPPSAPTSPLCRRARVSPGVPNSGKRCLPLKAGTPGFLFLGFDRAPDTAPSQTATGRN